MPAPVPIKPATSPLCSNCKRRTATKRCDFPIGHICYVGHPPRYLMDQAKRVDIAFKQIQMSWTKTCDKPLCDHCAISMNLDIDFCPTHIQEMLTHRSPK